MAKNIVICCDGTGNQYGDKNTNVIKLYSALDLSDNTQQIAYYHPGLGTIGAASALTRLAKWWTKVKGLAFGYGLTADIGDAYKFLMDYYEDGDRVYLYGFSRGAYTVRALSGMLHMLGLIRKGDDALVPYATDMLKRSQADAAGMADKFKATFSRECKPYFVGVWDTVSSVGWAYDPLHIPYTANNPDISFGRHAISIDERRSFFRQNLWSADQPGNIKQVWFAGVHSDIGGGYVETESALAKITLEWMLIEAKAAGLRVVGSRVDEVLGLNGSGSRPDANAMMHDSLGEGWWWLLEILPHRHWDSTTKSYHWKIPLGRRRSIKDGAHLHESVALRKDYKPSNLPKNPGTQEPWVRWSKSTGGASIATGSAAPG
jgi:uncharacterized protein (DUF2235 family)